MSATKYLDYPGLQRYDGKLKDYIKDITGTGFAVASEAVDIKEYIDSRIFVGTEAEINAALAAKTIDSTTFTMVVDPDAEEIVPVPDSDINALFTTAS